MKKTLLTLIVSLAFTPYSFAIDWYIGLTAGYSEFDSQAIVGENIDEKDSSYTFTWGMPVEEYFNLEFSYSDFGTVDHERKNTAPGGIYTDFNEHAKSIAASGVFNYALNDDVVAFGRLGVEKWDIDIENMGTEVVPSSGKDSAFAPFYGLGLDYNINNDLHAMFEVQYHDFNEGDTDLNLYSYQLGLRYFY